MSNTKPKTDITPVQAGDTTKSQPIPTIQVEMGFDIALLLANILGEYATRIPVPEGKTMEHIYGIRKEFALDMAKRFHQAAQPKENKK